MTPPRSAFNNNPVETSDRRITEDESQSKETTIYYEPSSYQSNENEISNKAPSQYVPSKRKYAKVFSYKDHKIVPQSEYSAKTYDQPDWNKPCESKDIPDRTHSEETKDYESTPVQPNSKQSEYEDLTKQLQLARINYLKSTMVQTKLPSYEMYAEKNFNGKQPEGRLRDKWYDIGAYPPTLPAYNKAPPQKAVQHQRRYEMVGEVLSIPGRGRM